MSGIRENLRLSAVTGFIRICSRDGYQTALILRKQTIWIQIPDTGRIVKTEFCDKLAKKTGTLGQVRADRLCHRSNLFMVSGVRFQVSVNTESGIMNTDLVATEA